MLIEIITLIIGILVILFLAEIAVRYSIKLAESFGWSGTFIGLTILSIGTSVPEIMAAIVGSIDILKNPALMQTISGLVVGTNVGSDIFQQTMVLSITGIVGTIIVVKKDIIKEVGGLIFGALLMWAFTLNGFLGRLEGLLMFLCYIGYLVYLYKKQNRSKKIKHLTQRVVKKEKTNKKTIFISIVTIITSFVIIGFAANKVIIVSTQLVNLLPISASFFGVIMLGVASALPELTTALIAILKHKKGISAGVLIGSNITNPLLGLGLGALISGYAIPNVTRFYDLPAKISMALLIFYFLWRNEKLNKWEAVVLISLFIIYLFFRIRYFPVDF